MPTARRAPRLPALGKLSRPRLGRACARERLWALLDTHASKPCTWVAGPPGSGKTTLVASWLEARAERVVWLQLDGGDADPATFAHFLGTAAAVLAPRRRGALWPAPGADDLRDVPGFVRRCLRRLAQSLETPWVLVLDNLQELGSASPLIAGLAAALTELPATAQLIAISREPPPPEFARALATQQLGVIDAPLLRFTLDETARLLALHGNGQPAAALQAAADGWAAAMILMLATGASSTGSAALGDTVGRERVFGYFAGEVLARMEAADAAALMRIAFLPDTSAAMAVALSGESGAGRLLDDLARRSLFTDRRGDTTITYTFHALFGEFLRERAAACLDADTLAQVQRHAARLLVADGRADAAIEQLIEAGAADEALGLLDAHASRFVAQGRTASLRRWLLALPAAVRAQPAALYWLGHCELALRPAEALHGLALAHQGYAAAGDVQGSLRSAAAAADAIVFIGARLDALDPWLAVLEAHAPAYLAGAEAERDAEGDLLVLPGLLAAFVHRQPQHPLTAPLADRAEALLEQPLGASQRILVGSLAMFLLWTGQVARLERIMVKIDRLCAGHDGAPATLLRWYGVGVLVRSLLGRVDEALRDARAALALAQASAAPALLAKAHLMMVLAALAARNATLASLHLAETAARLDPANAIDTTTYEFQRATLALLDGDWADAVRLMRAAVASGRESGWPLREHIALLGQALSAAETGDFDEAEAALAAAYAHRFHAMCRWHHWIAALIEARLADHRGQSERCLAALRRGFAVAREHGYDFGPMPFCCGDMMSRLAALALEHGIDRPFVLAMIRRHALPAPAEAGEHWPWTVRVCTLGRFEIQLAGAAAPASRKESRKPLDLLKLLIALGNGSGNGSASAVPVDRLAALLWPEAEGDAARNSFDNALHRLRKLLGGERHVLLRGGSVGLDPASCWTDVGALEACYDEAERAHDAPALVAIAERALGLYAGSFLAGDDEHAAVLAARQRIQARFIRRIGALGAALEGAGQAESAARIYQRVVEQEPIAEEIYRRLMSCLLQLGRRAEAYEAYRRCRSQLSILLGIAPSSATEAMADMLRGN